MLELEDVFKTFQGPEGPVPVLRGASVVVGAGELVAVQGPSGCGKSTLLLTAGAMLSPDSGRVRIAGEDPYALDAGRRAQWRARRVGFVFQQFHLIPYLDALDNVLAPTLAAPVPEAPSRARELLARFGLGDRLRHVPAELSVGERQRVAMARALLHRPDVLLADEPTGNLDDENARSIVAHLLDYAREGGAVLLATHDAASASAAHRKLRIHDGRVS